MKKEFFVIALLSVFGAIHASAHAPSSPPEDGLWYYEIGGAKPVSAPANPSVTSVSVGGNARLGLGYSCMKLDPVTAVENTLNEVKDGVENMLNAMTQAATGAIASLPAIILQRANPGLYDLFQNALVRAQYKVDLATKSCEQIEAAIGNNKNPYEDLIVLSKGNDWKVQMGISGNDPVTAQEAVESSNGSNGLPWIGGQAGGENQDPIALTGDIAKAGFNVELNRLPSSQGPVSFDASRRITQVWSSPDDVANWTVKVVGEHDVTTCEDCSKSSTPGHGLGPVLETEETNVSNELNTIVNSSSPPSLTDLAKVSAPGIAITRQVVESIQTLPRTERHIVVERLATEIAVARIVEKAFLARRTLKSGGQLPEVHANPVAKAHVEQIVKDLDNEIERLVFENRIRKELVSDTIQKLLIRNENRNSESLSVPEAGRRDPNPLLDGRVKPSP